MRLTHVGVGVAAAGLCLGLATPLLGHIAVAIFGARLIFAAATAGTSSRAVRFLERHDVSYGLYLYAWPLTKLIAWWHLSPSLIVIGALTWAGAVIAGIASWFLVERPTMRWVKRQRQSKATLSAPAIGALHPAT